MARYTIHCAKTGLYLGSAGHEDAKEFAQEIADERRQNVTLNGALGPIGTFKPGGCGWPIDDEDEE